MTFTYLRTLPLAPAAIFACCLLLAITNSTSRAAVIEYSWEGTIEPLDPAEDPWQIGAAGKPFTISVTVDENAVDLQTDDIAVAVFELSDVVLLIDGVAPTDFDDGFIRFFDVPSRDSVSIAVDDVLFNGVVERLFTGAQLSTSTFTFTRNSETPPVFPPAMIRSTTGSISDRSSYTTFVEGGAFVRAVLIPEPSTFMLALLGVLGVGITPWRSRREKQRCQEPFIEE